MKTTAVLFSTTVAAGLSASITGQLAHYGTSWLVIATSIIGAVSAIPDQKLKRRTAIASLTVMLLTLGAIGGPVLAALVTRRTEFTHPLLPALVALLLAHFGNDAIRDTWSGAKAIFAKRLGGKK